MDSTSRERQLLLLARGILRLCIIGFEVRLRGICPIHMMHFNVLWEKVGPCASHGKAPVALYVVSFDHNCLECRFRLRLV